MTENEALSCIQTVVLLRRLALNVHGVIDVVDDRNCEKIIELLKDAAYAHGKRTQKAVRPGCRCPGCYNRMEEKYRFCPCCGQAIDWEGTEK